MRSSRGTVVGVVAALLTPLLASMTAWGQPAAADPASPPGAEGSAVPSAEPKAPPSAAASAEAPPGETAPPTEDAEGGEDDDAPATPGASDTAGPPYPPPPYPPPPYAAPPYAGGAASAAPVEPPPAEPAPPPSATVRVGAAGDVDPRRDTVEPETSDSSGSKGVPPRLPWRGTAFAWSHSVTTTALGVGQSAIGRDHEQYVQSFAWIVNYYLVDYEKLKLRFAVAPSFDVEMTNSDTTTNVREPQLNDLPVSLVASTPLYSKKKSLWGTGLLGNFTTIFPLSEASQGTGRLLVTSPRLLLFQTLPLFGEDSPVLQAMSIGVSARWDHTFSKSEFPVNGAIQRPRGDFSGNTFTDDNLSGNPLAHDSLRFGAFVFLNEEVFGNPLWITTGFVFVNDYIYPVDEDYCHIVAGECVVPIGIEDPTNVRSRSGVSISLQYFPVPEIAVGIGYTNVNNHIAPDGSIRNPLYSPDAVFTASLGFSIDALYERMTGPKRSSPFLLIGKNERQRRVPTSLTF